MEECVKRTAYRDEPETVGVEGSAEAEASSHQPRKRCRKAKVAEGSSDQPQEGGQKAEVVEGSSDRPPSASGERKKERDRNRYQNMRDAVQVTREMGPQMEILKNKNAEFDRQLEKVKTELLPAITQDVKTMKEDIEIVKDDYKKIGSLIEGFVQSKENDGKIPLDYDYLNGKENISMVLASLEDISSGKNLMTDLENPADFSDLLGGMSKEEILARFGKATERHEGLEKEIEGIKSRLTNIETNIETMMTMMRTMIPKK